VRFGGLALAAVGVVLVVGLWTGVLSLDGGALAAVLDWITELVT